jgi:hypothetical protein
LCFDRRTGERSIVMAPASTSTINAEAVQQYFATAVAGASMVTSEISQVPLSGVQQLFTLAVEKGLPTFLDVDVTPSVALGPARLCSSPADIVNVIGLSSVLKLTASAAQEILELKTREKVGWFLCLGEYPRV